MQDLSPCGRLVPCERFAEANSQETLCDGKLSFHWLAGERGGLFPASLGLMCYLSLHWPLAFLNGNVELKLGAVESLGLGKERFWRNVNCGTNWISKFIRIQSGMLHRHWDRLWFLTAVIMFTNWAWFSCIRKNTSQLKSIKTMLHDSDMKYSRA